MNDTKINNAQEMKYFNRLQVLKMIATNRGISRSDITEVTGLTKMSVSNITADLLAAGMIEEFREGLSGEGRVGRTPMLLKLSDSSPCVLGICIGRQYFAVQVCDLSARVLAEESVFYPDDITGEQLSQSVLQKSRELMRSSGRKITLAGITAIGPVDSTRGMILSPPGFHGITNLRIVPFLEKELGLPCMLFHDAAAAALAEYLYGFGKGLNDLIYILIHNGIGAGIVINGNIIEGLTGLGGELGHTSLDQNGPLCSCGCRGCLELYANGKRLLKDYNEASGEHIELEPAEALPRMIELAGQGNRAAVLALDIFSDYLSVALGNLLNMISSENIFLGYQGKDNGILETMLRTKLLKRIVAGDSRQLHVRHSAFHSRGTIVGATAYAVQKIFDGEVVLDI